MRRAAVRDPSLRGGRVEVADQLRLRDGVTRRRNPDVRPPGVLERGAGEKPLQALPGDRGDPGRALAVEDGHDLGSCRRRILVRRIEAGLDEALRRVARGEEARRVVQVVVGELEDRRAPSHDGLHATRRRAEARPASRRREVGYARPMPKTLTGEELQLDDGPVKGAELFLVDGNNLAYRAFFALPEELQTTDGQPTNALLGFTNMLFKLLSDYGPRGVAVAWDTRPTHRTEIAETYKEGRRPMPDLLREQFPHFRPIVEAFGYSNLEFEGWEADDVIATLATRADEAGIRTCVVSTDRDAFQLCSENVSLMMTPRGVADVHVYTPERVELRYGVRPDQVPDFIGLKGDTSDNIPGIPGIGDKTAGQLIAQYGSLEEVIAHAGELSPARSKAVVEHADQARASKVLATMRRDLPLDVDVAALVASPPDRSTLKEIFRRFEFRGLLSRVDTLDEALPAAEPRRDGSGARALARGAARSSQSGSIGVGVAADGRVAVAAGQDVVVATADRVRDRPGRRHGRDRDARREGAAARPSSADDTMIARLPRRSGARRLRRRRPRARVRARARARAGDRGGDGRARPACRGGAPAGADAPRAAPRVGHGAALRRDRAAAHRRPRGHGGRRHPHRHVPDGGDHRPSRGARRGARGERARARRRGVPARLDAAARPDPVREARPDRGQEGEDRLLDRRPRPSRDPRRPRDRPGRRGVARADEAAQHVPPAAAGADRRPRRAAAHDDQPGRRSDRAPLDDEPEPPVDPDPHRARPADPLRLRRGRRDAAPLGRLQPGRAPDPRPRLRRAGPARGVRAGRGHPRRDRVAGVRHPAGGALPRPAGHREDGQLRDHLRHLVVRALREPRDPARGGAGADRHVPRAPPARPGADQADDRPGRRRRVRHDAARPPPARSPSSARRTARRGRSASGSRSTP